MEKTQTNNDKGERGRGTILNDDKIDPFAADDQGASDDGIPPKDGGKIDPFAADDQGASDGSGNPPNDNGKSSARNWNTGEMILDRYQVVELLGQGGMGVVYRCRDTVGNVDVAVKALPTEVSHSTTEMEEVRENYNLVSTLVHTNIAVYKTLEMDKATLSTQIVRDNDIALTDPTLSVFSAAQISTLLNLAIDSKATRCTAVLLNYKNEHFPEFAEVNEFSLDW